MVMMLSMALESLHRKGDLNYSHQIFLFSQNCSSKTKKIQARDQDRGASSRPFPHPRPKERDIFSVWNTGAQRTVTVSAKSKCI